jgi:hypothetical protein
MRILVTGLLGRYGFGGVTWDYLQYLLGFRALGHEVWYLEDTAMWAYDPVKEEPSADCSYNVGYLRRIMEEFGFGDRWIYRNEADGRYHGVEDDARAERLIRESDVLANVSGACWLRDVTAAVPHKLFLDGDPMFTQVGLATGEKREYVERVRAHTRHYSFGLNVGSPDCRVPTAGLTWLPTVQPVALEQWPVTPGAEDGPWTTVMNWASYRPLMFEGEEYGQKDIEFLKYRDLPSRVREPLVVAMGRGVGGKRPTEELEAGGWEILEPAEHLPDHRTYRDFLRRSKGEWSIAKHGYVASRSGWFSCRSACYLALGRPVVVQDTGWTAHLPHGEGVVAFTTVDEAAAGIAAVSSNYAKHAAAARAYAERHFEAGRVCAELLERM